MHQLVVAYIDDPEGDRAFGQVRDLEVRLVGERPRDAREALVIAALAFARVRDLDEVGGALHTDAFRLLAHLIGWLQAEVGVTAAELGLGSYSDGRDDEGPVFTAHDDRAAMQMVYDSGYLAAVRRFAPTFYPFVQRELDRVRPEREGGAIARHHEELTAHAPS